MSPHLLTPRAKADIEDIWDYTEARWTVGQAETYIRRIQAAIEALASEPGIARPCDAIRANYWKYPVASHIIFFRRVGDGIEVIRILHHRMDFDRHL